MIREESRTVPIAIWKRPGRNAGLDSSVNAIAYSGHRAYVPDAGSYDTYCPAACAFNHSRAYLSPVEVR